MKITLNILLLFVLFQSSAQNLVPNPSFEDTVACPSGQDQVYKAMGWSNYSNQSPDYMNACASIWEMGVPINWGGEQTASSGIAYCGINTFFPTQPDKREIIGAQLTSTLVPSVKYYFSMKVNLSISSYASSSYASNNIGARLSTVPYSPANPAPINNSAHYYSSLLITDTTNWIDVCGSFIADSAYNFIAIGNFYDDANTDTLKMVSGVPQYIFAYYYIDDIYLSTDSIYCPTTAGIYELSKPDKELIKIVDTMGRETEDKSNTLLIYIYSDGTSEKVYRIE